jgi:DNA-directed RNA polymerase specialized sigma24 family protein
VAEEAGLSERYVREWLGAMATAGLVEYDPQRGVFRLPPEQQQVIQLRFIEDWSHEEVAGYLGKTVEATRALQHRGLASLRKMLLGQEEEE